MGMAYGPHQDRIEVHFDARIREHIGRERVYQSIDMSDKERDTLQTLLNEFQAHVEGAVEHWCHEYDDGSCWCGDDSCELQGIGNLTGYNYWLDLTPIGSYKEDDSDPESPTMEVCSIVIDFSTDKEEDEEGEEVCFAVGCPHCEAKEVRQ